ncbi:MAG: NAD(P)-dependent oxidoreductase [Anaerolineales bacterium]|nr:MAG: NAD(P)-dependent oxidoreductase [Anaerolineales bacterium]
MARPGVIITGATGFLGGRLMRQLRKEYQIFAIGRRSPKEAGAPRGAGIHWFQVDIGHFDPLREVFYRIRELGGADLLLHLAAYYDFTGEDHPEYTRTNVMGTRNVLELAVPLKLRKFIYASSVAACPFPQPDEVVTEDTPPTAPVPYARSKRVGEEMIHEFQDRLPACILRLAAIFSNWCEYEPLDEFLQIWCSNRWNARILGGKGQSAVPYLHVRDLLSFYIRVVERCDAIESGEVLQASPDGSTTHLELYREATRAYYGAPRFPVCVPQLLARPGIVSREWLGRATGHIPFERSWMADYIDLRLNVDASRTRRRIDWAPNPDLHILKCMPVMIQNLRDHPGEWRVRSERRKATRLAGEL